MSTTHHRVGPRTHDSYVDRYEDIGSVRDWGLAATTATIKARGEHVPAPTGSADGSFTDDAGNVYARHGRTIVINGRGHRQETSGMARFLFQKLTEAAL